MARLSRAEARAFVDEISIENGGITNEDRAQTPARVLKTLRCVTSQLGGAITTLAKNLYTTDVRVFYELIQNAEDNQYSRTSQPPFLTFTLYPDKLIVDSNEDGFDQKNVRAICNTGKSSKDPGQQRYIGEKGIGFKSVFKVATKVHIQSEPYSFFFEHSAKDNGMGMVTPILEDYDDLPPETRTRIVLTLAASSDYRMLKKEILALPDSFMMFLSTLKNINLVVVEDTGDISKMIYSYREDTPSPRGTLTKRKTFNGALVEDKKLHYHITRKFLTQLPLDNARPGSTTAEVVLAFPLDEKLVPIEEQQHVFAFLPMRQVGFNFQVQSDFITQASREDLMHSARNGAILDGVAECFRDAVLQFKNEGAALKFQWMRFLPSKTISDGFWAPLLEKIVTLLLQEEILWCRSETKWKRPDQLRWFGQNFLDDDEEPLFEDLPEEIYLSSGYNRAKDKPSFDKLYIKMMDWGEALARIQADLMRSNSRMKAPATNVSWHNRTAKMLMTPFEKDFPVKKDILNLQMIPLQNGSWTSSNQGPIYHPDNNGTPVPTDLSIRLIDRKALQTPSRMALFSRLGLKYCDPEDVRKKIIGRYYSYNNVNIAFSAAHVRYLYWNLPEANRMLDPMIFLMDKNCKPVYRRFVTIGQSNPIVDDMYFDTDEEYGVNTLLSRIAKDFTVGIPEYELHLLHPEYKNEIGPKAGPNDLSWDEWLEKFAGVHRVPRLVNPHYPKTLSDLFRLILDYRKDKIIGTLNAHWDSYKGLLNDEILAELSQIEVPCQYGINMPLRLTYMPSSALLRISRDFGVSLNFVGLPSELIEGPEENWGFLKILGIRHEANLDFYLDILLHLVEEKRELSAKTAKSIFKVYKLIEGHSRGDDAKQVGEFFADKARIYIPAKGLSKAVWAKPSQCVWEAPAFIDVRYPLATTEGYQSKKLKHLFNGILDIRDADWELSVVQIGVNKNREGPYSNITDMYGHIDHHIEMQGPAAVEKWGLVRNTFEEKTLVYVTQQRAWFPPSSCLWTEYTRISGKVAIAGQYADLQNFFLRGLEVKTPDVLMFVEELKRLATSDGDPPVSKIKDLIRDIDDLGPNTDVLEPLKFCNILPVQGADGQVRLKNTNDVFAIVDRVEYENLFKGRVAILAYTIEDLHKLRGFLTALGIEQRYMSLLVEETSTAKDFAQDNRLTRRMRDQAYALFRCAVHYGVATPEDKRIYQKIRDTYVYVSEGIYKTITLSIQETVVPVEGARSKLHVESDDKQFRIFVPKALSDQEHCYHKQLPDMLVSQLGILNPGAPRIFGSILNASPFIFDSLLDDHGIIGLPWTDPNPYTAPNVSSLEEDTEREDQAVSRLASERTYLPTSSTPSREPSFALRTPSSSPRSRSRADYSIERGTPTRPFSGYLNTPRTSVSSVPTLGRGEAIADERSNHSEYHALLDRVITAAQSAEFPKNPGTSDIASDSEDMPPIVPSSTVFGRRSENQMSHDVKIGAAGELYVFEMLLKALPGFDQSSWASTVRKEVCIHERYANMVPWVGAETADITYVDGDNTPFTNLLMWRGYEEFAYYLEKGVPLKYYLEVKTTTKECGTRFYTSKAQYRRMHRMALSPDYPSSEVYIILRVYNLGQANMGMRVYIDPASWEKKGHLVFDAESYTVKPREVDEIL